MIYFLIGGDRLKIGTAKNVQERISTLQTGTPYKLFCLCQLPGDRKDEAEYHKWFEEYRTHNEWFAIQGRLLTFCKALSNVDRWLLAPVLAPNDRTFFEQYFMCLSTYQQDLFLAKVYDLSDECDGFHRLAAAKLLGFPVSLVAKRDDICDMTQWHSIHARKDRLIRETGFTDYRKRLLPEYF